MKVRSLVAFSLLTLTSPSWASFDTFEGGSIKEAEWQAAAGGPIGFEDFESFAQFDVIESLPSLELELDTTYPGDDKGWPSIYFDPGQHMNGPNNLGNFNQFNFLGRWSDMFMYPTEDRAIHALGFWNTDPQGNYEVRAYGISGQFLGSISAQVFWTASNFAGFVSSEPVYRVEFEGDMGDGWNHIDNLQTQMVDMQMATLSGTVDLQDWAIAPQGERVELALYKNGEIVRSGTVPLGPGGTFDVKVPAISGGVLTVQGKHWLRRSVQLEPLVAGQTTQVGVSLINGDIDRDNGVTLLDYDIFSDYYDKSSGDSDWSTVGSNGFAPRDADLDGDDGVTLLDYDIFSKNFDLVGD